MTVSFGIIMIECMEVIIQELSQRRGEQNQYSQIPFS